MYKYIDSDKVIEIIKEFLSYNEGDEATEDLIIAIGSQILDMSFDKFLEIIE